MKLLAFFLSFYILVLSAVPCSDVHNDCKSTKAKSELSNHHDHNNDQDDNCSPFCTCACCGIAAVLADFTSIDIKLKSIVFISKKVALYNTTFSFNFFGNIWQPPKGA